LDHLPHAALARPGLVRLPPGRDLPEVRLPERERLRVVVGGRENGAGNRDQSRRPDPPQCSRHCSPSLCRGANRIARLPQRFAVVQAAGSVTVQTVPRPTSLASTTHPPCPSTIPLTIASPSPVPPSSRLRDLSTR